MKYEIKNQRYTLNDNLCVNALVVGFSKKISIDEMLKNLHSIKETVPLLRSVLEEDASGYFFSETDEGFDYKIEECTNVNSWLSKQYNNPLKMEVGEFLRLAVYNQTTLVIFAHNIISDSRGLVNFAKAILLGTDNYTFIYDEEKQVKLNFLNQLRINKYKKLKSDTEVNTNIDKIKIKKISLKSDIVFSLCSSQGVSILSFFITVALSLSKAIRKELMIPFCAKEEDNIILVNNSLPIKFKRGLEPRLSFYDNCSQLDKLLKSFLKRRPYLIRSEILKNISPALIDKPLTNEKYYKFLHSDMYFDVLPTIEEDEILKTMSFYPSSSYISNGFGVSIIDDKITICSVLHNKEGEELFSAYHKTINLLSKNADFS